MMCHSRLCSELSISLHIASDHQCLTFLFVHKNDLADTAEHLQDLSHPCLSLEMTSQDPFALRA